MRREEAAAAANAIGARYRLAPLNRLVRGHAGVYLGDREGQSIDFHDYREYHPGDDLRRVDWRAYARTGQLHLKLYREEIMPVVELILDESSSMGVYAGKADAAVFLAAFFRAVIVAGGGKAVLCTGRGSFGGLEFDAALAASSFDAAAPFARGRTVPAGRRLKICISDFLFPEAAAGGVPALAGDSPAFHAIAVLSESEADPAWNGNLRLIDSETPGQRLDTVVDEQARARYRARLARHLELVGAEALRHGGTLVRVEVPDGGMTESGCADIARTLAEAGLVTPS